MTSPQPKSTTTDASQPEITVETAIEHAKRAFALKKYEQAAEHYATALEMVTSEHGDSAPEAADLYLSYGKALLENAIAQTSVLGNKEQPETEADDDEPTVSGTNSNAPILSFSGDADEGDGEEDSAVDLLAHANKEIEEAERETEEPSEDAEPEDDFNAAWDVLEMARSIYEGQKEDGGDDVKLKLADTYVALGDVSLETEKFDQAIKDYSQGLQLKEELLPISSRHIAEVHYKLSMVLDLTSGRLSDAISHVEKALESVESRMALLRDGLSGQVPAAPPPEEQKPDIKGKGKATAKLARDDLESMTKSQMESELKELIGLKDDLALKVEELKCSPNETLGLSAPELAARALDKELDARTSSAAAPAVVVDLTSMVKKKKKVPPLEDSNSGKRKAEGETETSPIEKKAKLDTPES